MSDRARRRSTRMTSSLFVASALLMACGDGEAAVEVPPQTGAASASGYGAYEPLAGLEVVIEATMLDHEGSVAEANEFGGVTYLGRSENAADWTTPDGLPVIVVGDLDVVASTEASTELVRSVGRTADAGDELRVLAPVGVYERGERYQLWLKPQRETGAMTYLAFDSDGRLVEGLDLPDADRAYDRLSQFTGDDRTASLLALAREMHGSPGPLSELVGLPTPGTMSPSSTSAP